MRGPPPKLPPPEQDPSYVNAQYTEDLKWVSQLVESAQHQKLYGKLNLVFNNGILVHVDTNRVLKPPHREK